MNPSRTRLARSPVRDFTDTLKRYRPDFHYLPRIFVYYLKFAFFEPFRYLEHWIYGRKIRDYRFKDDPIFILGYYRSGTTHLQELMLQDERFGYLNFYQCYFQKGFLVTEWFFKSIFGWIMTTLRYRHPAHNVPFLFNMPGEEDVSMVASGFGLAASWGQIYPRSFKTWFDRMVFFEGATDEEKRLFEEEMLDLFKRTAIANGGKQLLLKSPPQTGRLAWLARTFPRAKFVFIHRNPHQVFKSNQKLWRSFHDQALQRFTDEDAKENILWSFDKCLAAYERDKSELDPSRLIEVRYDDLQADPLRVVEKIYRHLLIPGFDEVKPRFEYFLKQKHGTNIDRYRYDEKDLELAEARLGRWLKIWNYGRPV